MFCVNLININLIIVPLFLTLILGFSTTIASLSLVCIFFFSGSSPSSESSDSGCELVRSTSPSLSHSPLLSFFGGPPPSLIGFFLEPPFGKRVKSEWKKHNLYFGTGLVTAIKATHKLCPQTMLVLIKSSFVNVVLALQAKIPWAALTVTRKGIVIFFNGITCCMSHYPTLPLSCSSIICGKLATYGQYVMYRHGRRSYKSLPRLLKVLFGLADSSTKFWCILSRPN